MTEKAHSQEQLLKSVKALPEDFHEAGVMTDAVLDHLFHLFQTEDIRASAETGCGKTSLLLSGMSPSHTVFTLKAYGDIPCQSYENVVNSHLFSSETTSFVLGPTQLTLPSHSFPGQFQFVLLDGPHGFPFPCLEYYYFYPHISEGGILAIDDVHIPSVKMLCDVLDKDAMFDREAQVENTWFYRRTAADTFNPVGDDWWLQGYNQGRKVGLRGLIGKLLGK